MSKWEDSFKKPITDLDNSSACHCANNQGLFVPNRQLSAIVAGLFFLFFCIFITGYFLGKKYAAEQFIQKMQANVADDNLYVSTLPVDEAVRGDADGLLVMNGESSSAEIVAHEELIPQEAVVTLNQDIVIPDTQEQKHYYAQLIGFGTEKAAEQFVKRLSSNGINTEIKKRVSKTVKGRTSYWYQVVTAAYHSKDDLSRIVDKLVKDEKLKDVCIRVC
jgi:hypothetical protein